MSKKLTEADKDFIIDHRLDLSMNQMADQLQVSYNVVRSYMIKNKLQLTDFQLKKVRQKNRKATVERRKAEQEPEAYIPPVWVKDPWNHGLNPVTMTK